MKQAVHVEIVQRDDSNVHPDSLNAPVLSFLEQHFRSRVLTLPFKFEEPWPLDTDPFITKNVVRIRGECCADNTTYVGC